MEALSDYNIEANVARIDLEEKPPVLNRLQRVKVDMASLNRSEPNSCVPLLFTSAVLTAACLLLAYRLKRLPLKITAGLLAIPGVGMGSVAAIFGVREFAENREVLAEEKEDLKDEIATSFRQLTTLHGENEESETGRARLNKLRKGLERVTNKAFANAVYNRVRSKA